MTTEYLLDKQVDMVLAALTPENALVMRVCLHTGLRLGDVLSLQTEQLRPNFWVTEQKTGKRRQVGLPEPLLSALKNQAGRVWVFTGRNGRDHRTRQAVWKDVKRAAESFRLPQNVAPHSARKVYAVQIMEKYGDIRKVQRALNHDNPSVTMIYAMADHLLQANQERQRSGPGRRRV